MNNYISLRIELERVEKWLRDNDWIPNKIVTGEWLNTDQRWLNYLEERKVKRQKRDELLSLLSNLK